MLWCLDIMMIGISRVHLIGVSGAQYDLKTDAEGGMEVNLSRPQADVLRTRRVRKGADLRC